ncbi:MAG: alpha/beta fold hydrolase [Ktedonobacterales bacterium]
MRPLRWIRNGAALVSLGVAAGALVVTARYLLETPQPLESALAGEGRIDRGHRGDIYYNVAGPRDAPPLVMLHDFYQGASNYEFRRVFPRLASAYRVYAPDWLGFGMSEHPALTYTGEFYAAMLTGFLRDVVTQPAIVIAHGRAANIAVRAASDTPTIFERLILVSPDTSADERLDPTLSQTLTRVAQRVSLGILPYALISGRPLLRLTATRRTSHPEQSATQTDLNHLYASAHQFGGHHAPLSLLTGELDLPMRNAFPLLEPPILIVAGEADARHAHDAMEELAILNPHADLDVVPGAGENVFEDEPGMFTELVTRWLGTQLQRQPSTIGLMAALEDETPALATNAAPPIVTTENVNTSADVATTADVADRVGVSSSDNPPTTASAETATVTLPVTNEPNVEVIDAVIESPGEAEALTETRAHGIAETAASAPPVVEEHPDVPLFTPRDAVPTRPLTRRPSASQPQSKPAARRTTRRLTEDDTPDIRDTQQSTSQGRRRRSSAHLNPAKQADTTAPTKRATSSKAEPPAHRRRHTHTGHASHHGDEPPRE